MSGRPRSPFPLLLRRPSGARGAAGVHLGPRRPARRPPAASAGCGAPRRGPPRIAAARPGASVGVGDLRAAVRAPSRAPGLRNVIAARERERLRRWRPPGAVHAARPSPVHALRGPSGSARPAPALRGWHPNPSRNCDPRAPRVPSLEPEHRALVQGRRGRALGVLKRLQPSRGITKGSAPSGISKSPPWRCGRPADRAGAEVRARLAEMRRSVPPKIRH